MWLTIRLRSNKVPQNADTVIADGVELATKYSFIQSLKWRNAMKKLFIMLFIFAILLSACVSSNPKTPFENIPTYTETQIPSLTTVTEIPLTSTPKIYTLRVEFSTSSDWSKLFILDSNSILDARLVDKQGIEIIPNTEVAITRVLPFLDAQILAKEAEEKLLQKDMQADAIQQIIWRLSAIKMPS